MNATEVATWIKELEGEVLYLRGRLARMDKAHKAQFARSINQADLIIPLITVHIPPSRERTKLIQAIRKSPPPTIIDIP